MLHIREDEQNREAQEDYVRVDGCGVEYMDLDVEGCVEVGVECDYIGVDEAIDLGAEGCVEEGMGVKEDGMQGDDCAEECVGVEEGIDMAVDELELAAPT